MRTIVTILLACLLVFGLTSCRKSRQLVAEATASENIKSSTTATAEELRERIEWNNVNTSTGEDRTITEDLTATIVSERLDTSGRVIQRTTAILTNNRHEESKKKIDARSADTTTERRESKITLSDTGTITTDTNAEYSEIIEREPHSASLLVAFLIIGVLVIIWRNARNSGPL